MKKYFPMGHYFKDDDARVMVEEAGIAKPLPFAGGKARHSPDGFSWGYWGSGPAELARAILADALEDNDPPAALYQKFKVDKIATIPQDSVDWVITSEEVSDWLVTVASDRSVEGVFIVDKARALQEFPSRCPLCRGKLEPGTARCPHGNCEFGWPSPTAEGRIEDD